MPKFAVLFVLLLTVSHAHAETVIGAYSGITRSTMTGVEDEPGSDAKARIAPLFGLSIEPSGLRSAFGLAVTNKGINADISDTGGLGNVSGGWAVRYLEFSFLGKSGVPLNKTTDAYLLGGGSVGFQIGCKINARVSGA